MTQYPRAHQPFSDREIELYLCGELDDERQRQVESAARDNEELRRYLEDRQVGRQAFYQQYPEVRRRSARATPFLRPPKPSKPRWWMLMPVAAAACALVVAVVVQTDGHTDTLIEGIRARGGLKTSLVASRDGRAFEYTAGALLRQGDQVRIVVNAPADGYVSVLGAEQGGHVIHYDAVPVIGGRNVLSGSLILDDAVVAEQWVIVWSATRLPASEFVRAGELSIPPGTIATEIRVAKEPAP
ncbi:MAG: hypothetical protein A2341_14680 [Deltaproteobacteria bacterium RIFOXYB12_FULL_58_9]|nr:MAG: hypothetical protein A2341_14680 [Deltaproteobacteria bacterium RIFOXYB12_FULL_58_9]